MLSVPPVPWKWLHPLSNTRSSYDALSSNQVSSIEYVPSKVGSGSIAWSIHVQCVPKKEAQLKGILRGGLKVYQNKLGTFYKYMSLASLTVQIYQGIRSRITEYHFAMVRFEIHGWFILVLDEIKNSILKRNFCSWIMLFSKNKIAVLTAISHRILV